MHILHTVFMHFICYQWEFFKEMSKSFLFGAYFPFSNNMSTLSSTYWVNPVHQYYVPCISYKFKKLYEDVYKIWNVCCLTNGPLKLASKQQTLANFPNFVNIFIHRI